jgi:hypothetical protein
MVELDRSQGIIRVARASASRDSFCTNASMRWAVTAPKRSERGDETRSPGTKLVAASMPCGAPVLV